jgi:FKBP-type peptidyl-prolyl cis-trans isomerase
MKKIFITILYMTAALALSGCAKAVKVGPNDANARFLDSWMKVHYPDVQPTELGVYIIENSEGTGVAVEEGGYAIVDYKIMDLEGNISSFTSKETAKQLGKYDTTYYYGSKVWTTAEATIQAGLADALIGMKAGGSRKVVIPSWLMTYKRYDRPEDYINPPKSKKDKEVSSTGFSNTVYEITVNDFVKDIDAWEISNIGEYFAANPNLGLSVKDSLQYGFYYKQLKAPADTVAFKKDTTIYINYTGRLLNGLVFDTTVRKTGLDNGLSASRSYKPVAVKLSEEAKDITMGGSSIIEGFALTLKQMHAFEKGVGIFYSPLGYKYSGSGSSIPGYAPLIFEIEIVEKPEE